MSAKEAVYIAILYYDNCQDICDLDILKQKFVFLQVWAKIVFNQMSSLTIH